MKQNIRSFRNTEQILEGRHLAAEGLETQQPNCPPQSLFRLFLVPVSDPRSRCHVGTRYTLPFRPCIFCLLSQLLRRQISKLYVQRENKTEMDKEKSLDSLIWFAGYRLVMVRDEHVLPSACCLLTQVHRHTQGLALVTRLCPTLSGEYELHVRKDLQRFVY